MAPKPISLNIPPPPSSSTPLDPSQRGKISAPKSLCRTIAKIVLAVFIASLIVGGLIGIGIGVVCCLSSNVAAGVPIVIAGAMATLGGFIGVYLYRKYMSDAAQQAQKPV